MNLSTLFKDLIYLYVIFIAHFIIKWWTAALGLISISIIFLSNFGNEIKDNFDLLTNHSISENYSNADYNLVGNFFIYSKEIVKQFAVAITDHWFSGGIILGIFILIVLMSILSLIKTISLIYKYSKLEIKDQKLLFDLIDTLFEGEQINFMDSKDSIKILLLHLYNLKICKW